MSTSIANHTNLDKRIIAIDFDGTITKDRPYPITEIRPEAIPVIKKLQERYICCLWTGRSNEDTAAAVDLLEQYGIVFDYVNESPMSYGSRKIIADVYIDDRNLGTTIDWTQIEKLLLGDN